MILFYSYNVFVLLLALSLFFSSGTFHLSRASLFSHSFSVSVVVAFSPIQSWLNFSAFWLLHLLIFLYSISSFVFITFFATSFLFSLRLLLDLGWFLYLQQFRIPFYYIFAFVFAKVFFIVLSFLMLLDFSLCSSVCSYMYCLFSSYNYLVSFSFNFSWRVSSLDFMLSFGYSNYVDRQIVFNDSFNWLAVCSLLFVLSALLFHSFLLLHLSVAPFLFEHLYRSVIYVIFRCQSLIHFVYCLQK